MGIVVRPHDESLTSEVRSFNRRLRAAGLSQEFSESPVPTWLPRLGDRSTFQELFLAVDGACVRGAYILKHQPFLIGNEIVSIGHYHNPISEGLVDPRFAGLGVQLVMDCLRRQPLLYSLGLGGMNEKLTTMLKALRWRVWPIPFYFRVVHPRNFLRNIAYLRRTPLRKLALDVLAYSGLGVALRGYHSVKTTPSFGVDCEVVTDFDPWVDAIWSDSRQNYEMAAVRDRENLRVLYPPQATKFIRLRVRQGGRDIGWAVCLNTIMRNDKYFGNMRLGSIIDCFGSGEAARKVVAAATMHLEAAGADLIVTNQCHRSWCSAMEGTGYLSGPSNFILAMSGKLSLRLEPFEEKVREFHLTRGDGDGPIHL